MTVSTGAYMKSLYQQVTAMGAKAVNSDMAFEIEGMEGTWLLCKQAPWPVLSPAGEIAIPTPVGGETFQAQQLKTNMQGPIAFIETESGAVDAMLAQITGAGTYFNAKVYNGTPQNWTRYKLLEGCFLQIDGVDRDWENRSQVLTINGTLFYNYFGKTETRV